MTNSKINALAREYSELNAPDVEDEALRENGIWLNSKKVFEPFLAWVSERYFLVEKKSKFLN